MSNVVALRQPRAEPHSAAVEFHLARREMMRALDAWVNTHPPAADAQIEIDGTEAAMRGLLAIREGDVLDG